MLEFQRDMTTIRRVIQATGPFLDNYDTQGNQIKILNDAGLEMKNRWKLLFHIVLNMHILSKLSSSWTYVSEYLATMCGLTWFLLCDSEIFILVIYFTTVNFVLLMRTTLNCKVCCI